MDQVGRRHDRKVRNQILPSILGETEARGRPGDWRRCRSDVVGGREEHMDSGEHVRSRAGTNPMGSDGIKVTHVCPIGAAGAERSFLEMDCINQLESVPDKISTARSLMGLRADLHLSYLQRPSVLVADNVDKQTQPRPNFPHLRVRYPPQCPLSRYSKVVTPPPARCGTALFSDGWSRNSSECK